MEKTSFKMKRIGFVSNLSGSFFSCAKAFKVFTSNWYNIPKEIYYDTFWNSVIYRNINED